MRTREQFRIDERKRRMVRYSQGEDQVLQVSVGQVKEFGLCLKESGRLLQGLRRGATRSDWHPTWTTSGAAC